MQQKIQIGIGFTGLILLLIAGITPTENEFFCPDSTARCYEEWTINNEFYIDKRPLHFSISGYEFYGNPIFWVIFVSERSSDLIAPRETCAGWFKSEFRESKFIPKLKIKKLKGEYFKNRYQFTFDEYSHPKIVMGKRPEYFNPFKFQTGAFKGRIN